VIKVHRVQNDYETGLTTGLSAIMTIVLCESHDKLVWDTATLKKLV